MPEILSRNPTPGASHYAVATQPGLKDAGLRLHYVVMGRGHPVILVHGIAASLHDWEDLMPALASYAYQAIAVDLLGHGESPKPAEVSAYTSEKLYESFHEWMVSLPIRPPFSIVGHSFGGYLALQYSLREPQNLDKMVLIDPLFSPSQLSPLLQWINRRPEWGAKALEMVSLELIDFLLGWDPINAAQFSPQARRQIAVDYKRASPHILRIPTSIQDLSPLLKSVSTPTLIIWGEKDLTLQPASFAWLSKHIPQAKGVRVAHCGHQPHIGKPKLVNRLILTFLSAQNVVEESLPERIG